MRPLILAALFAALALPAFAQDTRTVTDATGRTVTIPAAPQRIVTLHDSQLTIPLLELGVIPIGSHGRVPDDGGDPFIRSGMILAGTDFGNAPITWVGDAPADVEKVAALAPDLILTTDWSETPIDQLSAIAPTVVVDTTKSREEIFAFLAELAGPEAQDRLARLQARYRAQIDQLRMVVGDPSRITVSTFQIWEGTIYATHSWGNLDPILRDAGFARPAILEAIPPGEDAEFSLERLPEFDADVIIATYNTGWGNELPAERESIEGSIPGFCDRMFACREGQLYYIPRDEAASMSYDALAMTANVLTALLAGQEIKTRGE
jgi:iron complex transport system substrate-binding protein